jgi:microcompartment protein CcmL/EutN
MHAIGLIELNSIAVGVEVADAMAKTAMVEILIA